MNKNIAEDEGACICYISFQNQEEYVWIMFKIKCVEENCETIIEIRCVVIANPGIVLFVCLFLCFLTTLYQLHVFQLQLT